MVFDFMHSTTITLILQKKSQRMTEVKFIISLDLFDVVKSRFMTRMNFILY